MGTVARILIVCVAIAAMTACGPAGAPEPKEDLRASNPSRERRPWFTPYSEPDILMWEDEKKRGTLVSFIRREDRPLDTGLDAITAAERWTYRGGDVLIVAGFKGGRPELVTYGDTDLDGLAEERIGTYALPRGTEFTAFALRPGGSDFYGMDVLGARLYRFVDDDGDQLPERHELFAEAGKHADEMRMADYIYIDDEGRFIMDEGG